MIKLNADICANYSEATSREWLETNGIGGYASGTVSGTHTRRYHGMLIAATRPPLGRKLLLSKFLDTLIVDGESYCLSTNQYPGTVFPDGYKYMTDFRLDPFPVWTFEVGGIVLEKRFFMIHGENSTVLKWSITHWVGEDCSLELRPLLAFRDHHDLQDENPDFKTEVAIENGNVSFQPYPDLPRLYLNNNAHSIDESGVWYHNFEYDIERERGFDYSEDLFNPCSLRFDLTVGAVVIAALEPKAINDATEFEKREVARRRSMIDTAAPTGESTSYLTIAADQFIVRRGDGHTVIAGYPWFSDWGRDTMIALNGLTLATGRPQIAKSILSQFSNFISEGMLPNRFPDEGQTPDYNTVDATLWYFEAVRAYLEATEDVDFVRDILYEKLVHIISWHICGTRFQIHVDTDGLLYAGEAGVQLTWMDAKIDDWVVTPRTGKPVEIQALWYNALCVMADLAKQFRDEDGQLMFGSSAEKAKTSFNEQFWNESERCLYDVINGEEKDASVRPNQIFAVSLPHAIIDAARYGAVVEKVETELLTPYGLRTLATGDPKYVGVYTGSPLSRDSGYHQGTVWAWLIGPFVDAYRKAHAGDKRLDRKIAEILASFDGYLTEGCLGQVPEIFDGDAPHHPRGCPAQAWSVAELLRVSKK
jgi:predicted glycogen debranching enzyme